jgi:hypothetical protein
MGSRSARFVLPRRQACALFGIFVACVSATWLEDVASAGELPGFRVIVHPNNPLVSTQPTYLANVFLKKTTHWEGGETIRAVDLRADNAVRRRFSESVLKRSVGAVRSYWQQRIFSGRDVPPPELDSEENVVAFVARSPGAIGYVSSAAKLVGVRELSLK